MEFIHAALTAAKGDWSMYDVAAVESESEGRGWTWADRNLVVDGRWVGLSISVFCILSTTIVAMSTT